MGIWPTPPMRSMFWRMLPKKGLAAFWVTGMGQPPMTGATAGRSVSFFAEDVNDIDDCPELTQIGHWTPLRSNDNGRVDPDSCAPTRDYGPDPKTQMEPLECPACPSRVHRDDKTWGIWFSSFESSASICALGTVYLICTDTDKI